MYSGFGSLCGHLERPVPKEKWGGQKIKGGILFYILELIEFVLAGWINLKSDSSKNRIILKQILNF